MGETATGPRDAAQRARQFPPRRAQARPDAPRHPPCVTFFAVASADDGAMSLDCSAQRRELRRAARRDGPLVLCRNLPAPARSRDPDYPRGRSIDDLRGPTRAADDPAAPRAGERCAALRTTASFSPSCCEGDDAMTKEARSLDARAPSIGKIVPARRLWITSSARARPCASSISKATRPSIRCSTTPTIRPSATAPQDTIREQGNIYLSTGTRLLSDIGTSMLTIVADTAAGTTRSAAPARRESNTVRYALDKKYMHACRDNFLLADGRDRALRA